MPSLPRTALWRRTALLLGCVVLLGSAPVPAPAAEPPGAKAFLDALAGAWQGRAVSTPRGPLPYDIGFERDREGAVSGTANPGAALHHWRFLVHEGQLRLRFLTTFGGNTEPTWLYADELTAQGVSFRARRPTYLSVRVVPAADKIDIQVRLHDEPHVHIVLSRPEPLAD